MASPYNSQAWERSLRNSSSTRVIEATSNKCSIKMASKGSQQKGKVCVSCVGCDKVMGKETFPNHFLNQSTKKEKLVLLIQIDLKI